MGVAAEIRKKLPICGDCVNCKLVVWNNDAKTGDLNGASLIKLDDGERYNFTVRCNWLKSTMRQPLELIKCEGKRGYDQSNEQD